MHECALLKLVAVVALSLGSRGLAGHLVARVFASGAGGFVPLYCGILTISCGLSLLYVGWSEVSPLTWKWALAIFIGALAGTWCAFLDRRTLRAMSRRRLRVEPLPTYHVQLPSTFDGRVIAKVPLFAGGGFDKSLALQAGRSKRVSSPTTQPFVSNAGIACLEEFVYRGALLHLASASGSVALYWTVVTSSVLGFALGHANFGIQHIVSKLPLAIVCMGLALWQGVFPAVSCHVAFNLLVTSWMENRRVGIGAA